MEVRKNIVCLISFRGNCQELVFCKKPALKSFAKLAGKHLYRRCSVIKKETPTRVFSSEFCEIFHNGFFVEHILATVLNFLYNSQKNSWDGAFFLVKLQAVGLNFHQKEIPFRVFLPEISRIFKNTSE